MRSTSTNNEIIGELQVLVFGPQARTVGTDRMKLGKTKFPITADALMSRIVETYPNLSSSIGVSRLAVNHEFVESNSLINAQDEVALVGLISGG
ncbi:molybdopterin converting factor small subunit [Rhodopirellula rubra]|uniref:Molybdopterin converting factor small subunit n=1 Tax=Aporhodopirellula rubra TaxID=980271 RepID=A0A7W5E4W9_9BACT|nr:MoaD/ThiS family protein [Aporhodopirellula rubra]MBB3209653.1 molybdopterin converting factor small subunit [Aporhodopirellula rubra]